MHWIFLILAGALLAADDFAPISDLPALGGKVH